MREEKEMGTFSYILVLVGGLGFFVLVVVALSSYQLSNFLYEVREQVAGPSLFELFGRGAPKGLPASRVELGKEPVRLVRDGQWMEFSLEPDEEAETYGDPSPPLAYRVRAESSTGLHSDLLVYNGGRAGEDTYFRAGEAFLFLEYLWEGRAYTWHIYLYLPEGWRVEE